jgi:hypothetical protein
MTIQSSVGSSIARPTRDETRTAQVEPPALLVAGTAELRRDVDDLHGRARGLHRDSQETQLSLLTHQLNLTAPQALLDELADEGVAWALVARIVGVTPAAVRKWRRGETVTPTYNRELAEFVAFCRLLRERNPLLDDVDQWLDTPAASQADVTHANLYIDGHRAELLNIASSDTTGDAILDEHDPGWRDRRARARRWKVVHHEDGTSSIVDETEAS